MRPWGVSPVWPRRDRPAIGAHLDRIAKIDFGLTPTFRMPGKSFSRRTTLRAPEASGALRSTPTSLALRSFPCRRSKAESPAARAIFRKGWRAQRVSILRVCSDVIRVRRRVRSWRPAMPLLSWRRSHFLTVAGETAPAPAMESGVSPA
jgi:hypothetical protein